MVVLGKDYEYRNLHFRVFASSLQLVVHRLDLKGSVFGIEKHIAHL